MARCSGDGALRKISTISVSNCPGNSRFNASIRASAEMRRQPPESEKRNRILGCLFRWGIISSSRQDSFQAACQFAARQKNVSSALAALQPYVSAQPHDLPAVSYTHLTLPTNREV